MDDELFDVFDEQPAAAPRNNDGGAASRKRKANGHVKSDPVDEDESMTGGDADMANSSPDPKRVRTTADAEMPLVTDTFETEQSREIAASAGLQAHKDDAAVILRHQVRHQTALPPASDYDYKSMHTHRRPEHPAREWKFKLDPFQELSITAIERNESVLVSAHTSAGKTVVAEYAIAQCLKNNQRVIYTSPIKALSNQKYREFKEEFGDVGLMTGDVTIDPTASCLVMTTEILRSMLYRGSEIMREVAWVVFDEVHYLRDKERGVVWEETIILLPDKVRYVFLSATIPNAMQFAEWIAKIHNQPCHVVYTNYRPTPLQHYFFPAGADGIHLIVDEKGVFREENFNKAMTTISDKAGDDGTDPMAKRKGKGKDKRVNKGGKQEGPSDIYKIVKMIMMKNYNPVIVFSFSKRECETYALQMSQLAFNDDNEKEFVSKVFNKATMSLSEEDKNLDQIQHVLPLLRRGIGIHHSGLLPILKEIIEILFQEGLIKVLFATETFSIGLNMPAKTVVFTSVRKFDGVALRWVTPGEFIQMSGRAGRRGLDERGIVIMMVDEAMDPTVAKTIVRGEQEKLNSAFYLGYNMILNLMRVEGISPEFMLERCFYQFQNAGSVSGLQRDVETLEQEKANMVIERESEAKEYYELRENLDIYTKELKAVVSDPQYLTKFLQPGRLVKVKHNEHEFGWGAVVNYTSARPPRNQSPDSLPRGSRLIIDVLMAVSADSIAPSRNNNPTTISDLPPNVRPAVPGEALKMEIVPVTNGTIDTIAQTRIFLPNDLRGAEQRNTVRKTLEEVLRRFPDGIAPLDPIENMHITDASFKKLIRKIEILEGRFLSHPIHNSPDLEEIYDAYAAKMKVKAAIKDKRKEMVAAESSAQLDELKSRKRVLRRLNFISESDVVTLKARVACEISTGDELVLSELLLNGFFNSLSPELCAATLSVFIFEEKSKDLVNLKDELAVPFREILNKARVVAKVAGECKVLPATSGGGGSRGGGTAEEEYVNGFKCDLMETVYEWTKGASFATICKMTEIYEGSLIRLFRRLEELLRQIALASKVMGNEELEAKFVAALGMVRRDLVAAASLYL